MQPTAFSTPIDWQQCSEEQRRDLLTRPAISASDRITESVSEILSRVRNDFFHLLLHSVRAMRSCMIKVENFSFHFSLHLV